MAGRGWRIAVAAGSMMALAGALTPGCNRVCLTVYDSCYQHVDAGLTGPILDGGRIRSDGGTDAGFSNCIKPECQLACIGIEDPSQLCQSPTCLACQRSFCGRYYCTDDGGTRDGSVADGAVNPDAATADAAQEEADAGGTVDSGAVADASNPAQDAAVEPVDAAVEPVDAAVEPVDAAVEPVDAAVEPVDAAVEPVDAAVEPADAAVEPVDAAVMSDGAGFADAGIELSDAGDIEDAAIPDSAATKRR